MKKPRHWSTSRGLSSMGNPTLRVASSGRLQEYVEAASGNPTGPRSRRRRFNTPAPAA